MTQNNHDAKYWEDLGSKILKSCIVSYEPHINSRNMQGKDSEREWRTVTTEVGDTVGEGATQGGGIDYRVVSDCVVAGEGGTGWIYWNIKGHIWDCIYYRSR